MRSNEVGAVTGEIYEEHAMLSVQDLCRLCAVDSAYIVALVEEGVLETHAMVATDWQFPGAALRRARTALRLQRDLEINLPGVALALQLMEEMDQLRSELRRLHR